MFHAADATGLSFNIKCITLAKKLSNVFRSTRVNGVSLDGDNDDDDNDDDGAEGSTNSKLVSDVTNISVDNKYLLQTPNRESSFRNEYVFAMLFMTANNKV